MKKCRGYRCWGWLLVWLITLLPPAAWAADPVLHLNKDDPGQQALQSYLAVLEDPAGKLTQSDIVQAPHATRFVHAARQTRINDGQPNSAYWLRLTLQNDSTQSQTRLLELGFPSTTHIDFYQSAAPGSANTPPAIHTGLTQPFATRPYRHRLFIFPVTVAPGQSQTVYARLKWNNPIAIPAVIWTEPEQRLAMRNDYATQALYFGMLLAMILFNLLLYLALRDRVYLLYVVFSLCSALTMTAKNGMGKEYLWPNLTWWPEIALNMCYSISVIALIQFMRSMLDTRVLLPRLDRALAFTVPLVALNSIGIAFAFDAFLPHTTWLFFMILLLVVLGSLYGALHGQRSALYFLLAFGLLLLGSFLNILRTVGLVGTNLFTANAMQLGSAMEMVLLAFALANRFESVRRQKNAAELSALQAQQDVLQAQSQLLQAEKMAALGQLMASISHEINTPLAAVKTSAENLESTLPHVLSDMPQLFAQLSPDERGRWLDLIEHAAQPTQVTSSREERSLIRHTTEALEQAGVPDARQQATLLVQLQGHTRLEQWLPLLRHPLAESILANAQHMLNLIGNTRNINRAVARVATILRALKSFSRVDQAAVRTEVDLAESLETVLTLYQGQLKRGVELVRHYEPIAKLPVLADELNQVWTNLIHNALQAMDYRGTLTIGIRREANEAIISVGDSGCGIPAAIQPQIFDAFFTTKPDGEGSGLGLDIVRRIVQKHAGRINFHSETGVGTTFFVHLPYPAAGSPI
jgi:signal transduction histidine kinase